MLPAPLSSAIPSLVAASLGVLCAPHRYEALLALVIVTVVGMIAWAVACAVGRHAERRAANDNDRAEIAFGWSVIADRAAAESMLRH